MEKKVFNIFNFRKNNSEYKAYNVSNDFSELSTTTCGISSTSGTDVKTIEITQSQPPFAELPDCNHLNKITLDLGDLNSGPMRPILKVCNY